MKRATLSIYIESPSHTSLNWRFSSRYSLWDKFTKYSSIFATKMGHGLRSMSQTPGLYPGPGSVARPSMYRHPVSNPSQQSTCIRISLRGYPLPHVGLAGVDATYIYASLSQACSLNCLRVINFVCCIKLQNIRRTLGICRTLTIKHVILDRLWAIARCEDHRQFQSEIRIAKVFDPQRI